MTTKTTQVREAIVQRLLALGADSAANIGAVCNPEQIRNPANRAADPRLTAVLWTMPGQMLDIKGSAIKWQQPFIVDIAVPWSADAEQRCDKIRLELAAALVSAFSDVSVLKSSLGELDTGYPAEGSGYALISATATFEYLEKL